MPNIMTRAKASSEGQTVLAKTQSQMVAAKIAIIFTPVAVNPLISGKNSLIARKIRTAIKTRMYLFFVPALTITPPKIQWWLSLKMTDSETIF